ncbi:serine hydrolase domain-containing protein [Roseateles toxinivorans]|uniref:CubicO group peptidase (Beta-lactamase class C family) n=1 Tax=Roseateles toxinivorans TaxID=270368 RepID=A0A4R6QJM7_9BURK|nr:serine hydrolase domain-containing protein [Roseateles toxinivorans]TDP63780.1 CubicO group peptidase (beta-lactamase class C family) [Roseateles toxinivorans]
MSAEHFSNTLPICTPEQAGLSRARLENLRAVLQRDVDAGRLPGAVLMIARRGQVAWQQAVGQRRPGDEDAMTMDTLFRIYSMTKPIVSVAMMRLIEQGRALLSDPVSRYIPAFADSQVAVERGGALVLEPQQQPATLQDLLRHSAGLTYAFTGDSPVQRLYGQADLWSGNPDNAEFCAALARLPLAHQPGRHWAYSHATDVLGHVVELIAGEALSVHLQREILAPLQMHDTAFSVPPGQQHRIAEPFAECPESGTPVQLLDPRQPPRFESGGGGLISSALDYARFVQMLRNGGELDGVRLLSPHTLAFMTADHIGDMPQDPGLLDPGHGFGLGFAVRREAGRAPVPGSVGTFFWSGVAGTSFWVDPAQDLFALLLTQAPNQRVHYRQLFRALVYGALV